MYPHKPLAYAQQLARLKSYLRRGRTELRHKYDEFFEATKGRRDCPLEVQVRHRAVDHARDTVQLLETFIKEVQRQQAMFLAPFKPGDRILVEREAGEISGPYLITDVVPDKKTRYAYECVALTKGGSMYKRGGDTWVRPNVPIRASDVPLNSEGAWQAEYLRRCAETSRVMAMQMGDITLFEARKAGLGEIYYRRNDRLDPPGAPSSPAR